MTASRISGRTKQGFIWRDPDGKHTAFVYVTRKGGSWAISNRALAMLLGFILGLTSMAIGPTAGMAAVFNLLMKSL